jgi:hypothetical protein
MPRISEDHYLGSDRQVVVVVAGVADSQVDAAMGVLGEAAAMECHPLMKNTAQGIGSWYSLLM